MKKRRTRARSLMIALLGTIFGLALVLFPLRGRGAEPPSDAGRASTKSTDTPPKGAARTKKGVAVAVAVAAGDAPADTAGDAGAPVTVTEATPAAAKAEEANLTSIPIGRGLPVKVNVGVFFLELKSFDDTKGEFEATTDLRLQWTDTRLRFPRSESFRGYKEWRGKEAEEQLAKLWTPTIDVANRLESSGYVGRRLRIYPNGDVETLTRTTARHTAHVSAETFPFDRQRLALDLIVRDDTTDEVLLRFDQDDVVFSRAANDATLDGWEPGLVELHATQVAGWNGDRYARMTASLVVDRLASSSLAPIFIPLLASLLIPLLAVWMNKTSEDGGEFEVDAFELANMCIGGLFSVIALSFAIYSSYTVIANGDNTVTRLFGLNYAMLAITLAIVVVCFRYNLLAKLFGPYVQREAFTFMSWALPVLSLATSLAFLLVAAA